jgi:competence ComEA-like helix-hairpin-helix protein
MSFNRIVATAFTAFGLILPVAAQDLPAGPGKAVFEKMCTQCHGVEGVVRSKMSKDRWMTIVDDMVSRGAKGSDEEIDTVIDYLAANFGRKVNVNKATASDLTALGLTADEAQAVIKYRVEKGTVKDIDELAKVPGVAAEKVTGLKDRVEF